MNRLEWLQQLVGENSEVVGKMRSFAEGVIDPSVNHLSRRTSVLQATENLINGIMYVPGIIQFRGKTLADYSIDFRKQIVDKLRIDGPRPFEDWHTKHWLRGNRSEISPKIMERNMNAFVYGWFGDENEAPRPEPDWEEMQRVHEIMIANQFEQIHGVYASLYYGFQARMIEYYLEAKAAPSERLTHYFLH